MDTQPGPIAGFVLGDRIVEQLGEPGLLCTDRRVVGKLMTPLGIAADEVAVPQRYGVVVQRDTLGQFRHVAEFGAGRDEEDTQGAAIEGPCPGDVFRWDADGNIVVPGGVGRPRGNLAALMGRLDEAVTHFEEALEIETRLGARGLLPRTQCAAARVLLARDGVGDRGVEDYCATENIPILMRIPLDRRIAEAYSEGVTMVEELPEYRERFVELYRCIEKEVAQ